ncbi:MAG: hypothetical protein ABI581_08790 [Sediminibacterium sp.]
MNPDFFTYIEQLELVAFFAGYPLIFAIVRFLAVEPRMGSFELIRKLSILLPYAYALTATLYLGMVLNNMYPHYSLLAFREQFSTNYLKLWGVVAIFFWIPALGKKSFLSVLHSLVFFFLLLADMFRHINSIADGRISNDMKMYTNSLLLNTATLAITAAAYFILNKMRKRRNL